MNSIADFLIAKDSLDFIKQKYITITKNGQTIYTQQSFEIYNENIATYLTRNGLVQALAITHLGQTQTYSLTPFGLSKVA